MARGFTPHTQDANPVRRRCPLPVFKCGNGKYRIGSGPCMYGSRESAEKAYKGYKGSKGKKRRKRRKR